MADENEKAKFALLKKKIREMEKLPEIIPANASEEMKKLIQDELTRRQRESGVGGYTPGLSTGSREEKAAERQRKFVEERAKFQTDGVVPKEKVEVPEKVYDVNEVKQEAAQLKRKPEDYSVPEVKKEAAEIAKDIQREEMLKRGRFAQLRKAAGKVGKKLPGIAGAIFGAYNTLKSGDANAAVSDLSGSEDLGPAQGTLEYKLESGQKLTPEEVEMLRKQMENTWKK
jgi:hypothetical protein